MNPAKPKTEELRAALAQIPNGNRRQIIEDAVRPQLAALKSDWNHSTWDCERFLSQISTLETWATEIWKKPDFEMKVGKFLSELQELEDHLKP